VADKSSYDRLSLTLPVELHEWLHQFTLEIKKNGGYKLPKTLVIRAFIRTIMESGIVIDLTNIRGKENTCIADRVSSVKLEDLLVSRIIEAIRNTSRT
jgi:tRNA 2-selenouridine synthase SelU